MKKIRFYAAMLAAKFSLFALKLLGRNASYLPGKIALTIDKDFLLSFLSWKHIHPLILLDNVFTIKGLPTSVKAQGGHGGHGALPQGT